MASSSMQPNPTPPQSPQLILNGIPTAPPPGRPVTDEEKQDYSWQYVGYPGLSEWMASSGDFFMLRRFSKINARYLLYLQHEIGKREQILEVLDQKSQMADLGQGPCGSFERERLPERTQLIQEIGSLLRGYYDHINSYSQVRSKRTADKQHLRNLHNWFQTYEGAIVKDEQHFWRPDGRIHDGDLFEMISYPKSPLRWLLNKSHFMRLAFKLRKPKSDEFTSETTRYYSNAGFDQFVCFVTVLLGLALLFAPMWYLHFVQNVDHMLGIITAFVSLFAFWLWVAAGPRQFEILLGSAAYAAVLYIYLQAAKGTPGAMSKSSTP